MNNKKAISGIIITVVLVVLVLVSITIVWNVISDIIADQAGNVDSEAQCIGAGLTVSSINCDATPCSVVMKRQVGANANRGSTKSCGCPDSNDISGNGYPQTDLDWK